MVDVVLGNLGKLGNSWMFLAFWWKFTKEVSAKKISKSTYFNGIIQP